jgi:hypothetical protein
LKYNKYLLENQNKSPIKSEEAENYFNMNYKNKNANQSSSNP